MTATDGAGWIRKEGVLFEVVDGTAVLLDHSGAEMIVLNPVGTIVWDALDGTRDETSLVRYVLDRVDGATEAQVRVDVDAFLAELGRAGLVTSVEP